MTDEPDGADDQQRIGALIEEVQRAFPDLPPEQVREAVMGHWREFSGANIREFVPLLVRRRAITHLRAS